MDRIELGQALQEIDDSLTSPCEIVLVGGAAMILHFGANRATRDIDMVVLRGDVAELRQAIRKVALVRNWPEDWMNDGAKGFADIWPPTFRADL